ncbi:MAG: molybdenum cofactor biosynthesis protein MoaE [Flavobacteriales bacterium]|nr:molybdenum cofactor biosynthesis protein MoaE [Flavobacteriales bacterium]
MKNKIKNTFVDGAIQSDFIADSIRKHQHKTSIGAHQIFLGQVREDLIEGKKVKAIEYSAYEPMANEVFKNIREAAFERFDLTCLHIYHSLNTVKVGELCLFVFVSSPHRKDCFNAIQYLVEEIKEKAPIFGKEILEDDNYQWKTNT